MAVSVALFVTCVVALRLPAFGTAVANLALGRIALFPGATFSVREARGDWLTHLETRGLRLTGGGITYLVADTLRLEYRLWPLLRGGVEISSAELAGVTVDPRLFKLKRPVSAKPPRRFTLDDLLRGRFYGGPRLGIGRLLLRDVQGAGRTPDASLLAGFADSTVRVMSLELEAHEVSLGDGFAFALDTLVMRLRPVRGEEDRLTVTTRAALRNGRLELAQLRLFSPTTDVRAAGALEYSRADSLPDVWLTVDASPFDLADLSPFAGTPDSGSGALEGTLRARVELRGSSLDSVSGTVRADLPRGRIAATALDRVRLEANLARGLADVVLDAGVEGAPVAARGWVRPLDARPEFEIRTSAPQLPARLGGLAWWPGLARRAPFAVGLRARGHGYRAMVADFEGTARGEAGDVELQAHIDRSRDLAWQVGRLSVTALDVARVAGTGEQSRVSGVMRASGTRGPRGQMQASATLDLEASGYGRWNVSSGRVLATLDEQGGGARLSLESADGSLQVDTLTWRMDGSSPFRVRGARIRLADIAKASGSPGLAGSLEATAELEGTGLAHLFPYRAGARALRDGRVRARGRIEVAPSRFRGHELRGGAFDLSLARGQVTLSGALESDAGRVTAEADSRPFDEAPRHRLRRLRFDAVDLGAWLGNASLRSNLGGTLTAELLGGLTGEGASATEPSWTAKLELDRAHVGPLAYERGEWLGEGRGSVSRVDGRLDAKGGTIRMGADLRSAGDQSVANARIEIPFAVLPPVLGRDTLSADGELTLALEATGSPRDPRAMLASGQLRAHGSVERANVDSLRLSFHLERGMLTVDTLALRSDVAAARASGHLALVDAPAGGREEPDARLHAELEMRDPSRLAPLLGADSISLGSGSLVVDVSGPVRDRRFSIRSDLRTLVWNQARAKRAMATAQGRLEHTRLEDASARVEAQWVTVGALRVPSARLEANGDSKRLDWRGDVTFRDRDSLSMAGDFEPDSSGWRVALDRMDLTGDSTVWRLARPARLRVRDQRFEVDGFEAVSQHGRLLAKGVLDRAGTQDFHLELRDVGLAVLSSWKELGDLRGALGGTLDVTGPAAQPRANGDLRATLDALGRPVGVLGATFDWTQQGFDVHSAFTSPGRDSIVLSGHLPIAFTLVAPEPGQPSKPRISGERAEIRLRSAQFPLVSLQPLLAAAGVGALAGTLDMDLRLSGGGSALRGDGEAAIAAGRLELPGLGGKYSELKLRAGLDGDRLVLREFHTLAGKGRFDASGSLRFASLTRVESDLTFKADRALLVDTKQLKMLASGEVRLGGTFGEPTLKGRLHFGGSQLLIASDALADPNAKTVIPLSPEDLRTLEETFTYIEPSTPDPLLGLYDAAELDLAITLDRNNWIRQTAEPRLSVEVFGEVRMQKKPGGEPQLVGRLEPLPGRGYLEQFGRSFALTGGEVLLNGPMSSHTLDIRAQYPSERDAMSREGNDVVVHLDLQGTLEKMRLVFSSEPPLSETEIITFIATGRSPTTRTGQSQDLGSEAANLGVDMGMAMVSGALEDAAKGSVGLDVLKVGYDGVQGTTLIAGRYVAPQLYVGFRQPLQTMNTNTANLDESADTKVELEYAAYRWLVLNVQGESSFIRSYLRFKREY